MNGAAIFEVADKIDVEVVEGALGLVDTVEVEEALRGVHVGTVTGIDDRHGSDLGSILCCAFDVVAHDDDVGIVAHHEDGVLERLAFGRARGLGIGEADDTGTETVGGRLERQLCTCGGFEEEGSDHFALEKLTVGMTLKLFCHLQKVEQLILVEIGNRDKITFFHYSGLYIVEILMPFVIVGAKIQRKT